VNDNPELMVILNDLMRGYEQTAKERDTLCNTIDAQIAGLQETRRLLAEPFEVKLAEIEAKMRQPMLDRAATFVCSYGKVAYRKGAVRRSWNLDALDQICNAKPEVKEQIWAFREEKIGEPSITVKLE